MLIHLETIIHISLSRFDTGICLVLITRNVHQPNVNAFFVVGAILKCESDGGNHFTANAVERPGTKMRHSFNG